jgi:GAF domain-containing protein
VTSPLPLSDELSHLAARTAGLTLGDGTAATALRLATSIAHEASPGSTGAGITVVADDGWRTAAASSTQVDQVDALQYRLGEGPCIVAAAERTVVTVHDTVADERWPRWGAEAAGVGVRSALSVPVVAGDHGLGAVKVYGPTPVPFDPQVERLLSLFAALVAVLVVDERARERGGRWADELRQAVRDRDTVNIARGVLMTRDGIDRETALAALVSLSAREGRSVAEVSAGVVRDDVGRR